MKLFRILDPFTATLVTVVLLASFFPARGAFVPFFEHLTTAAIAMAIAVPLSFGIALFLTEVAPRWLRR